MSDQPKDPVHIFTQPTQVWLEDQRGKLRSAARAAYKPGMSKEERHQLANSVAIKFDRKLPQLATGDDAARVEVYDANKLPDGVPEAQGEARDPRFRVRVWLKVVGDASLLALRPAMPNGEVPTSPTLVGNWIVETFPHPLRDGREKLQAAVARQIERLNNELWMVFLCGTKVSVLEVFDALDKERAASDKARERIEDSLRQQGCRIGAPR